MAVFSFQLAVKIREPETGNGPTTKDTKGERVGSWQSSVFRWNTGNRRFDILNLDACDVRLSALSGSVVRPVFGWADFWSLGFRYSEFRRSRLYDLPILLSPLRGFASSREPELLWIADTGSSREATKTRRKVRSLLPTRLGRPALVCSLRFGQSDFRLRWHAVC